MEPLRFYTRRVWLAGLLFGETDPAKRADSIYQALLDEVRRRPPVPRETRARLICEEGLFGAGNEPRRVLTLDDRRPPPIMPFFRIEF